MSNIPKPANKHSDLLQKIKEYIIPILSFVLSVITFFVGKWTEVQNFNLEREKLQKQQSNIERELQLKTVEIQNLQDQNQRELQYKYVELLTQNLDEQNLVKAELVIHLIENPSVKASFARITQDLVDQLPADKETRNSLKANFANVTFDARAKIEQDKSIVSEVIERQFVADKELTTSQVQTLAKYDEEEMLAQTSRRDLYQKLMKLLNQIRNQQQITSVQSQEYVQLHLEILNKYADESLKESMTKLFEVRKDSMVGAATKGAIDEVILQLQNNLSKTMWCKANYFVNWRNITCSVLEVNKEEGYVRVDLINLETDAILLKDVKLEVGKPKMIQSLKASVELVKIDKAGKNFLKPAGYFKFSVQP